MATKKKELLEQEAPVSETIALEDSPVPSEDTTDPDATPVDGEGTERSVVRYGSARQRAPFR